MSRYCSYEFNFIDFTADKQVESFVYSSFSKKNLLDCLSRLKDEGKFKDINLIVAEIGLNEYIEFFILIGLKFLLPNLPSFVTLHDPPKTVLNLSPFFARYEEYTIARGFRRAYNYLFGTSVEKEFYRQGHNYILLSKKGVKLLEGQLGATKIPLPQINCLPLINFYEEPNTPFKSQKQQNELFTFGYLGFLNRHKGIDILIRAAESLIGTHAIKIVIAGGVKTKSDKNYIDNLKSYVTKKGLDGIVEFTGYLDDEQIPVFMRNLDVMILPYKRTDSGSASGPLMWARSFAIPIIASDTRTFPENIKHGKDGLLFNADDVNSLTVCLQSVLDNRVLLNFIRMGAYKRKEECSHRTTAFNLRKILLKYDSNRL
jgi:glycosyltransferase involved in cell wall biosynthesis